MQTPGELSHSSSSVAAPGNLPEASHSLRQLIQFTGVNRVLQALLEGHNNLRLRTKLLLWLLVFLAAPPFQNGRGAGWGKGENSGGAGSFKKKKKITPWAR